MGWALWLGISSSVLPDWAPGGSTHVLLFGGGDDCFHNVPRDNLARGYHHYVFADDTCLPSS